MEVLQRLSQLLFAVDPIFFVVHVVRVGAIPRSTTAVFVQEQRLAARCHLETLSKKEVDHLTNLQKHMGWNPHVSFGQGETSYGAGIRISMKRRHAVEFADVPLATPHFYLVRMYLKTESLNRGLGVFLSTVSDTFSFAWVRATNDAVRQGEEVGP